MGRRRPGEKKKKKCLDGFLLVGIWWIAPSGTPAVARAGRPMRLNAECRRCVGARSSAKTVIAGGSRCSGWRSGSGAAATPFAYGQLQVGVGGYSLRAVRRATRARQGSRRCAGRCLAIRYGGARSVGSIMSRAVLWLLCRSNQNRHLKGSKGAHLEHCHG